MAFNIKSSGSYYAIFDDSKLSSNKYYTLPNENGTIITSNSTGSYPFTASRAGNLDDGVVTTNKIVNDAVTYGKIQNVTGERLLGRANSVTGDTQEITLGTGLSFDGTTLNAGGASVTNAGNNRVITSDGGTGLVGESNMQFDGSRLAITGSVTASQYTGSLQAGTPAFIGLVTSASFVQTFDYQTATHTWNKPSWAQTVTVIAIGGGGGGGGAANSGGTYRTGGGGGAGSEIVIHTYRASDLPNSVSIQVGAGGYAGGVQSDGGNGGLSRFGSYGTTTYRVLVSYGGYGGSQGQTDRLGATVGGWRNVTDPAPGKPSSYYSTGGGGGGMGTVYGRGSNSCRYNQSAIGIALCDAPSLPYTVNDAFLQSRGFTTQAVDVTNRFSAMNLLGAPGPVGPTGGGGGTGVITATKQLSDASPQPGQIMAFNQNSIARNINVINDQFSSYGIILEDVNYQSNSGKFEKFFKYIPSIGFGGRGGTTLTVGGDTDATAGSDYGGGGGGGGFSTVNATTTANPGKVGGKGIVIVISEA